MVSAAWIYLHIPIEFIKSCVPWYSCVLAQPVGLIKSYPLLPRADGPDPLLVLDSPKLLTTVQLCRTAGLEVSHHIQASCKQAEEAVTANCHQEVLGSKQNKMRREKLPRKSPVSQVWWARTKWLLLMHTRGFQVHVTKSTSGFWKEEELEGTSINPISVSLHWTPSEPIERNVLSYFCAAWQLEGLKMVDHERGTSSVYFWPHEMVI